MDDYQPLAIQLRPKYFKDFIYNEPVVMILKNMILKNQLPNGVILSGIRGIGKTTLARIIARSLNCENRKPDEFEPCGECPSCKDALAGIHSDIIEISGSTHGKIEDIRDIIDSASYTPFSGKFKIFIIDEAQGLGASRVSWGALLKVLEEPPDYVFWIFCTSQKDEIPVTIKSRLLSLDLKPVPTAIIKKYIMEILAKKDMGFGRIPTDEVSEVVANCANNSIRDALTVLEKIIPYCDEKGWSRKNALDAVGAIDVLRTVDIIQFISQHNAAGLWATLNQILESGVEPSALYDSLASIVNNLMSVYLGAVDTIDQYEVFVPFMSSFHPQRIVYMCDIILKRQRDIQSSNNKKMVMQLVAMEICA